MANPLTYVTADFWDVVRTFDRIVEETGQPVRLLMPQFELVKEIDTDAIRSVADDVWGTEGSKGSLRNTLLEAAAAFDRESQAADRAWEGEAYEQADQAMFAVREAVERADEPIKDVALSLNELADSCDESIGDIVTSLAEVGGIITAAGGFFVGLMAAPEPAVTKILGVIVGVIGLIVAAVAALGAYVKAIEQRQQAPEEGIAELRTLVDRLRR